MKPKVLRPILLVTKFDECFRFYRDILGLDIGWGKEGDNYASFFTGKHIHLSIFAREMMAETVGASGLARDAVSQDRVALTFGVKDVRKVEQELELKGVRFVTPVIDKPDWGIRTIFIRDPDGNLIQLESAMDKSEWTPRLREEASLYKNEPES